jgi:hypothetical protein
VHQGHDDLQHDGQHDRAFEQIRASRRGRVVEGREGVVSRMMASLRSTAAAILGTRVGSSTETVALRSCSPSETVAGSRVSDTGGTSNASAFEGV